MTTTGASLTAMSAGTPVGSLRCSASFVTGGVGPATAKVPGDSEARLSPSDFGPPPPYAVHGEGSAKRGDPVGHELVEAGVDVDRDVRVRVAPRHPAQVDQRAPAAHRPAVDLDVAVGERQERRPHR